jgi:hypothetical protein
MNFILTNYQLAQLSGIQTVWILENMIPIEREALISVTQEHIRKQIESQNNVVDNG